MIDFSQVKEWHIGQNKVLKANLNGVDVWSTPPQTGTWTIGDLSDAKSTSTLPPGKVNSTWEKNNYIVLINRGCNGLINWTGSQLTGVSMKMTYDTGGAYAWIANAPEGMTGLQSWLESGSVPHLDGSNPPSISGVSWKYLGAKESSGKTITWNPSNFTYSGNGILLYVKSWKTSSDQNDVRVKWMTMSEGDCEYYSEQQHNSNYNYVTDRGYGSPYLEFAFGGN